VGMLPPFLFFIAILKYNSKGVFHIFLFNFSFF
jgi:hypothetical protein